MMRTGSAFRMLADHVNSSRKASRCRLDVVGVPLPSGESRQVKCKLPRQRDHLELEFRANVGSGPWRLPAAEPRRHIGEGLMVTFFVVGGRSFADGPVCFAVGAERGRIECLAREGPDKGFDSGVLDRLTAFNVL